MVLLGLFGFEEREWKMNELTILLRKKVVGLIYEHEDDVGHDISTVVDVPN